MKALITQHQPRWIKFLAFLCFCHSHSAELSTPRKNSDEECFRIAVGGRVGGERGGGETWQKLSGISCHCEVCAHALVIHTYVPQGFVEE